MITTAESVRTTSRESTVDTPARRMRWEPFALAGIVVLALLLYGWNIGSEGWGNSFYSAAVRSMSENWTNFLFGSFDPAGVVTVDKPPMGFWPQVLSAWVFGYKGWALALPQVIEGAGAVFLLHRTVRHWMGEHTALLAALILSLTPITVAIDRVNNPDAMLTLLCAAAAYALTRALHADGSRAATLWLSQAAFWVGCGFVTKMLAGWMIVPAIGLAYLFGRDTSWGRRIIDLVVATAVLLASSLWWVALTALWPSPKPFVGGSDNGGAWNLVIGYNGLGRVFGQGMFGMGGRGGGGHHGAPRPEMPGGAELAKFFGGGDTGPTRLFGASVGGQISWLFPLCLLVLVVVVVSAIRRGKLTPTARGGWILWGSWLLVLGAVFSTQQGIFHSYYTTQLAPAVAALSAAGTVLLWRYYRNRTGYGWLLLPAAIALTAVWAWVLISRDTSWNGWLRYAVAAAAVIAIVGLIIGRGKQTLRRGGLVLGIVAVLMAPAVWSAATPLAGASGGGMASAGPPGSGFGGGGHHLPPGMAAKFQQARKGDHGGGRHGGTQFTAQQKHLLDYVTAHAAGARIVLAVEGGSRGSAPYIINSTATVIGMGGFMGGDNAPSVQQLAQWKSSGQLGFVLEQGASKGGGHGFGGRMNSASTARTNWVKQNCTVVPPSAYGGNLQQGGEQGGPFGNSGPQVLYRCTAKS